MTKSHAAGWPEGAPTAAQLKELLDQIDQEKITKERMQLFLRGDKFFDITRKRLRLLLRGDRFSEYEAALSLLGQNFVTPEEIMLARGIVYNGEQLERFVETFLSGKAIKWCRDNDAMLIAGPPEGMSLPEVYRLNSELFCCPEGEKSPLINPGICYDFLREDKVEPKWRALRKSFVPGSTGEAWKQELLPKGERVPNVTEAAWGLTTFEGVIDDAFLLRGGVFVRTSSVISRDNHLVVGYSSGRGLEILSEEDLSHKVALSSVLVLE